jgi:hypothetical protein
VLIGRFSSSSLLLQPPVEISLFFFCFFFSLYLFAAVCSYSVGERIRAVLRYLNSDSYMRFAVSDK